MEMMGRIILNGVNDIVESALPGERRHGGVSCEEIIECLAAVSDESRYLCWNDSKVLVINMASEPIASF